MNNSSLRLISRSIIGAWLMALAIPAQANQPSPDLPSKVTNAAEGGKSAGKDEKPICKRIENSASRMKSVRVCHTEAEWRKIEDAKF